jgi:O-antigen ligase
MRGGCGTEIGLSPPHERYLSDSPWGCRIDMTETLLSLFFFARPIMFIETDLTLHELNLFELLTVAFTSVLAVVAGINAFRKGTVAFSALDGAILVFVFWCSSVAMIYPDSTDLKSYFKLVLPPLTFFVLKRAIASRQECISLLKWLILGFIVPVGVSALMIYEGKGVAQRIFWTGLERYSGVYNGIHTMGHNMGFLIILVYIYFVMRNRDTATRMGLLHKGSLLFLCSIALYCLVHGHVRTVYVGLLIFFGTVTYLYSKRLFFVAAVVGVVLAIAVAPFLSSLFFDVTEVFSGRRDVEEAGSGRPLIWNHNLAIFANLPFDRQIAGVGIGNFMADPFKDINASSKITMNHVWNSHNDFLEVLMEIGAIGLFLIIILYLAIGRAILRMRGRDRHTFFALFLAVVVMNALSNSYIARFGLGQMFFMLLVYVERPEFRTATAQQRHLLDAAAAHEAMAWGSVVRR